MTAILPHTELHGRVVEFLNREAEMLDEYRFSDWLNTLSPDITYRMPVRTTQFLTDGKGFHDFALIDDDYATLETRVKRLETEFAWAETPPSRTRHFVTNVLVERLDDTTLEVRSCFMITRTRSDLEHQIFTGLKVDRLADDGERLLVLSRVIEVDQTAITNTNLSIFF
jgi:3-phenylpropionate/cinnamic acid dioxygenase small subunit